MRYGNLTEDQQNQIIEHLEKDELIKVVRILNEARVTIPPLSECCGRAETIKKVKYGIDNGFIKKTGRKV